VQTDDDVEFDLLSESEPYEMRLTVTAAKIATDLPISSASSCWMDVGSDLENGSQTKDWNCGHADMRGT
jgi:hypothetical protein